MVLWWKMLIDSWINTFILFPLLVDKVEALKHYKFSLAFENSNEEDYVTEKFFQSLVAGIVTFYFKIFQWVVSVNFYVYSCAYLWLPWWLIPCGFLLFVQSGFLLLTQLWQLSYWNTMVVLQTDKLYIFYRIFFPNNCTDSIGFT